MGVILFLLPLMAVSAHARSSFERQDAVAEINNRLAADIHKKLSTGDENVFFSPLSISTALAMLYYGSRGTTAEEMRRALGYQDAGLSDSDVSLAFQSLLETFSKDSAAKEYLLYVANAVITQKNYPILDEYKNGLQSYFNASAREVDFGLEGQKALQEINDWVKKNTNGQIEKLLDDIDPATIMVLLNAVYFKGTWKMQFDPKNTKPVVFYNKGLESEPVKIPMMYLKEKFPCARLGDYSALELPYKGEDVGMIILLPNNVDGLAKLEDDLNPNMIKDIRKVSRRMEMKVTLPKFKLEYKTSLNKALQGIGIRNAFGNSADLSGISKAGQISVSEVVHKAVIDVNEEGSEASAVTGIIMTYAALMDNEFVVNHPFVFVIADKRNNLILFQGRVNNL